MYTFYWINNKKLLSHEYKGGKLKASTDDKGDKGDRESRWWNRSNRDTKTDAMEISLFQLSSMELLFFFPLEMPR